LKNSTHISLVIFAIIGFLDSLYLYYVKLTATPIVCFQGSTGCQTVENSAYSSIYGVPNGLIGMIGYGVILIVLGMIKYRPNLTDTLRYFLFGFSLIGFLFSVYLTSISLLILKATCPFCILSAIMMTAIFIISIFELRKI
jgi:uncharacterized membrane protein